MCCDGKTSTELGCLDLHKHFRPFGSRFCQNLEVTAPAIRY
jgi:hypothetical protein